MKAWRAKIYGLVQQVGFRASVKRKALERGLAGTVRNLSDGSVEIIIVGEKSVLDQLLADLNDSAYPWRIERVIFEPFDSKDLPATFEVIHM